MTDGWKGILDDGETILWQGRPDGAVTVSIANVATSLFGLAFAGFALFWMIMASQAGGFFWMFGLIHFTVGLGLTGGPMVWSAYRRRNTWYTLTDQRAFIASSLPVRGKTLDSFPITEDTMLSLTEGPPDSLFFATRTRRTKNGTRQVKVGFERIEGGKDVYRMMRDVQKRHRQADREDGEMDR
ncbi:hypothetical protein SAMN05444000_10429 [Shimia gijangensis]|uniref:Aspartate carbamoyltransferase catalytic subunit n=1 Tax=Shimia gijangensis TaxID=1470563 RepID=A0A1M6FBU9_9RHOB|nr:aspartate carbamoyltransferase catalytic subunit [Shimia gijangensis]SHI95190.1 hypothetical protein SAMN05444000_10429 [Shimia gijangensis]